VNEHIIATLLLDEAETLFGAKPLHDAFSHSGTSLQYVNFRPPCRVRRTEFVGGAGDGFRARRIERREAAEPCKSICP
jgi:hypothetical protein